MTEDAKKPNFALLIGKKLDQRDGTDPPEELPDTDQQDGSVDNSENDAMQDSAVADLLAALKSNSVPAAKLALKDLIKLLDQDEEV